MTSRLAKIAGTLPVIGVGIACCALLAVINGNEPHELIVAVFIGAWGSTAGIIATIIKTTPLLLTGLAVSLAYQVGLLNIGCEGQLTLGALAAATMAGTHSQLPPVLLLPAALAAGIVTGMLWAAPAVWLRQRHGVHEVISTLLLNYLAIHLSDYLVRGPLGDGSGMARTAEIAQAAMWSPWWRAGTMGLTEAPMLALLLVVAAQLWLSHTVWGYEAQTVGSNDTAAKYAGIRVTAWQWRLFLLSGALSGLAGALEILAVHHRFYASFSPGYGYDGITVAFLSGAKPGWVWVGALLLASLRATDKWLQLSLGISPNSVFVIEAVLLLAVACQKVPRQWLQNGIVRFAKWIHRTRRLS